MSKGVAAFTTPKNNDMMFAIIDPQKWKDQETNESN